MKVLAIELATAKGSLAWINGAEEVFRQWPNDRKNSGAFFENLADVQRKYGLPEEIIVGLGPGSYAGTRIAISAAIGLQVASRTTLVGYPSICAMDTDAPDYCVIGDARRHSFFFAQIRDHESIEGPMLLSEVEMKEKMSSIERSMPILASEELAQFDRVQHCYPSAKVLARLAAGQNCTFVVPPLEPMYLREPHITIPKSKL